MKSNRVIFGFLSFLVLLTIAVSSALFTSRGQERPAAKTSTSSTPSMADLRRNFPSVDYSTERSLDPDRLSRTKKYDKVKSLDPTINQNVDGASYGDWLKSSSPLPVEESQLVVLGKVTESVAALSYNKNSVFSEFKIEVEKVFKNGSADLLEEGKYIRAEREGGIVNFPTGFSQWYFVSGQNMPAVGDRLLFFLTHDFPQFGHQDKDLFLLTGYRLSGGIVSPLDLADGGTHPTATYYRGKPESVLISDLEKLLRGNTKHKTEEGQ